MSVLEELKQLATVDLFSTAGEAAQFVGRPFYFDYSKIHILVNDAWKQRVGGIPAGAFLVAVYDNEPDLPEVVLVRVLGPTPLPTDTDIIASMVDYYKENVPTGGPDGAASRLDSYTRYEFQFSGLACRVLGSFFREPDGRTAFGADVDNFYSANNYSVYKPVGKVLEYLVNFREGIGVPGGVGDVRIGQVRYAASRHHPVPKEVPVYVTAFDFLGKRTALFGMTRTGKSNTVKKIIQATMELSRSGAELDGAPLEAVGQIVFDVNGEYANDNQQDEGTAIYQLFKDDVTRYSLLDKPGFRVMKLNFYTDLELGFGMVQSHLAAETADYFRAFLNIDWAPPDPTDFSATTRYDRKVACYRAILHAAGFPAPANFRVTFQGTQQINGLSGANLDPRNGLTLDEAVAWFGAVWQNYGTDPYFTTYAPAHGGREWADEDLKSLMQVLTRASRPGGSASQSGYRKLIPLRDYHTNTNATTFFDDIVALLRNGRIVIVDLSQGDPAVQVDYCMRICTHIFQDAMNHFISFTPANFIQFYFEEAHNLFPRQDDPDLTHVYNRLAKEGAKLRLGLLYATQEVSSISANVLKNTQNWFISHLNNLDELREVAKYYDFEDFLESIRRATDKGFIRMKTYSNAFVVPVQIDRFTALPPRAASPAAGGIGSVGPRAG